MMYIRDWWTYRKWLLCYSLLFVCLCWILLALYRRRVWIKKIQKLPGFQGLPIIGNTLYFLPEFSFDKILAVLQAGSDFFRSEGNGIFVVWQAWNPLVVLTTASAVEPILSSSTELQKNASYEFFLRKWLRDGLILSTGRKWQFRRKLVSSAFHIHMLKEFLISINIQCRSFLQNLCRKATLGKPFDVGPLSHLLGLDIICDTMMGTSLDAQRNEECVYAKAKHSFDDVNNTRQSYPWLLNNAVFRMSKHYQEQQQALTVLKGLTKQMIDEKREYILSARKEMSEVKKQSALLDLLVTLKTPEGEGLTDEAIQEEVDTFILAGHETAATALNATMFLLGLHPNIQERCCAEVESVLGDKDKEITLDDLKQLKYLECCIKESMRVYPPGHLIGRRLINDMTINGFEVPAGTELIIDIFAVHRDPQVWEDPEKFDPERFNSENIVNIKPYSYIPFSAGLKNCIGQKFAMIEMKTALCQVLRNFRIHTCGRRDKIAIAGSVIMGAAKELNVQLTPKKHAYSYEQNFKSG